MCPLIPFHSHPEAGLHSGFHKVTEKINSRPGSPWLLSLFTPKGRATCSQPTDPDLGNEVLLWIPHALSREFSFLASLCCSPSPLLLKHFVNAVLGPILGSNPHSTTCELCSLGQVTYPIWPHFFHIWDGVIPTMPQILDKFIYDGIQKSEQELTFHSRHYYYSLQLHSFKGVCLIKPFMENLVLLLSAQGLAHCRCLMITIS